MGREPGCGSTASLTVTGRGLQPAGEGTALLALSWSCSLEGPGWQFQRHQPHPGRMDDKGMGRGRWLTGSGQRPLYLQLQIVQQLPIAFCVKSTPGCGLQGPPAGVPHTVCAKVSQHFLCNKGQQTFQALLAT